MGIALIAGTNVTITAPAVTSAAVDTTGAKLLICVANKASSTAAGDLISDSQGNTWHALTNSAISTVNLCIWYSFDKGGLPLSTSAAHTCTIGAGSSSAACFAAFTVTQTTPDPFDQQNQNNAASTTCTTGSITPSQNNELVIAGIAVQATLSGPYTIDSGYSILGTVQGVIGTVQGLGAAFIVQGTAGATNPTWTVGSSGNLATAIASFKAAALGSAAPSMMLLGVGTSVG